jgi:hypothetical protein
MGQNTNFYGYLEGRGMCYIMLYIMLYGFVMFYQQETYIWQVHFDGDVISKCYFHWQDLARC